MSYASVVLKADSGASKHYIRPTDAMVLQHRTTVTNGPCVSLPDNTTMRGTHQGHLPFNSNVLSAHATRAHVFPHLSSASLLSLGQLCDDDCNIFLDKHSMRVFKNNNLILTGLRNHTDGLWDVSVSTQTHPTTPSAPSSAFNQAANVIIRKNQTTKQLAQYLHAACGSPPISTFLKAIKNGLLQSWPGIDLIKESDLLPSIATAKGHLDQERKNLQSTKPSSVNSSSQPSSTTSTASVASNPAPIHHEPPTTAIANQPTDPFHTSDDHTLSHGPAEQTQECFAVINAFDKKAYSDLTGRYPHISSRGNQYILVVYDYDSSGILVEPLKNRQAAAITNAWHTIHTRLERHGNAPKLYVLDNEISFEFKKALRKKDIAFQLVPPHVHRRNAAERAIRTFKNHFLSVLATADPEYPVAEWDRLLPQAELTLNLLRPSRINPRLSSYHYLFGLFDFNKTPLAPAGTKVLVHEKSRQRASWANHGVEGWYIGPSMDHYRCVKCFLPSTGGIRDADTVQFFPKRVPFPKISTEDMLLQSATDILAVLQSPPPSLAPTLQYGDEARNAIDHLARLLQRAVQRTKPTLPEKPLAAPPRVGLPSAPRVDPPTAPQHLNPPASLPRVLPRITRQSARLPVAAAAAHVTTTPLHFANPDPSNVKTTALNHILATDMFSAPKVNHIYNSVTGKRETIDSLITGSTASIWRQALSNELGRLSNGLPGRVQGTNTISFIHKSAVPSNKKVTYANMVCDYRPLKSEPNRVRLTVGGDRLDYAYDVGSPAASLLEAKLLINSTISDADRGARFFAADLKDFFLATPMDECEYMRIHSKYFFDDVRQQYDIDSKIASDGYVYICIHKGMYGLKQAAVLAYNQLVRNLKPHGYFPCPFTAGLWKHATRKTKFCLCVDDFGVKSFSEDDKAHFLSTLRKYYNISVDENGSNYLGLTIDWNYRQGFVDISMPGYIPKLRSRLNHPQPSRPQHAPHRWTQPAYGKVTQFAPQPDSSPFLNAKDTKELQSTTGSLLYYSRAVDPTLLPALNEIATSQARPTEKTRQKVQWLMDFVATYPNAKIRFYKSDMILYVDSDAAYLVLPNARSRFAGHFFLSNRVPDPFKIPPPPNGPIHTECRTIRNVVASAAEAETAGLFGNSQIAVVIRRALQSLDHPQPPTPIKTDNSTANSFVHSNIRQKRSKTWDMRYNWLRDRKRHDELSIYWDKGSKNAADYFTKHHPPAHHKTERPKYILKNHHVTDSALRLPSHIIRGRGCVNLTTVRYRFPRMTSVKHP